MGEKVPLVPPIVFIPKVVFDGSFSQAFPSPRRAVYFPSHPPFCFLSSPSFFPFLFSSPHTWQLFQSIPVPTTPQRMPFHPTLKKIIRIIISRQQVQGQGNFLLFFKKYVLFVMNKVLYARCAKGAGRGGGGGNAANSPSPCVGIVWKQSILIHSPQSHWLEVTNT